VAVHKDVEAGIFSLHHDIEAGRHNSCGRNQRPLAVSDCQVRVFPVLDSLRMC
jgi:hypothetical protein